MIKFLSFQNNTNKTKQNKTKQIQTNKKQNLITTTKTINKPNISNSDKKKKDLRSEFQDFLESCYKFTTVDKSSIPVWCLTDNSDLHKSLYNISQLNRKFFINSLEQNLDPKKPVLGTSNYNPFQNTKSLLTPAPKPYYLICKTEKDYLKKNKSHQATTSKEKHKFNEEDFFSERKNEEEKKWEFHYPFSQISKLTSKNQQDLIERIQELFSQDSVQFSVYYLTSFGQQLNANLILNWDNITFQLINSPSIKIQYPSKDNLEEYTFLTVNKVDPKILSFIKNNKRGIIQFADPITSWIFFRLWKMLCYYQKNNLLSPNINGSILGVEEEIRSLCLRFASQGTKEFKYLSVKSYFKKINKNKDNRFENGSEGESGSTTDSSIDSSIHISSGSDNKKDKSANEENTSESASKNERESESESESQSENENKKNNKNKKSKKIKEQQK